MLYGRGFRLFVFPRINTNLHVHACSVRNITKRLDWAAYPRYTAPEKFAPFLLDGKHLYYVNAFENAASTIETGAVAAENVARLLLSRLFDSVLEEPSSRRSASSFLVKNDVSEL
jgi:prenylcysteine oxidase/farnesylcysteine lyase